MKHIQVCLISRGYYEIEKSKESQVSGAEYGDPDVLPPTRGLLRVLGPEPTPSSAFYKGGPGQDVSSPYQEMHIPGRFFWWFYVSQIYLAFDCVQPRHLIKTLNKKFFATSKCFTIEKSKKKISWYVVYKRDKALPKPGKLTITPSFLIIINDYLINWQKRLNGWNVFISWASLCQTVIIWSFIVGIIVLIMSHCICVSVLYRANKKQLGCCAVQTS